MACSGIALVYVLKAKQGYTVRKIEKYEWIWCLLVSAGMKFSNRKNFRYGIPAYTGPFRALPVPNEMNPIHTNHLRTFAMIGEMSEC
jgi:hypothetical protein